MARLADALLAVRWLPLHAPVAAAAALAGLTIWSLWPVQVVQVANETTQRTIARLAAEEETPLRLSYVHSLYRQPATEELRVRADSLELVRIASPSRAVLEYYARPEPIVQAGGEYAIHPVSERYASLTVLVGDVGRRTLAGASREVPLYRLAADGDRITLRVAHAPRLALVWPDRS